jgi:hypothetical protein
MGPAGRRLLGRLEVRMLWRVLATSLLVALAALILYLQLAAAALAFAPPRWALSAQLFAGFLPVAAALALAGALLPLARRPSRRYLAVLIEKAFPHLAGALVLLAEDRTALDPGVAELSAERVEQALAGRLPSEALRFERRSRLGPGALACAMILGLVLLAAGRGRYLDALGEVTGVWGSGPTRIIEVSPGDVVLEEGQLLATHCRVTGRRPEWVRVVFKGGGSTPLEPRGDDRWAASVAPGGTFYRIEVGARDGLLPSESFKVTVLPRPGVSVAEVVYHYPEYTGLKPRKVLSREIDCLQLTRAEVFLKSVGNVKGASLRLDGEGRSIEFKPAGKGRWKACFTVRRVGTYSVWMRLDKDAAAAKLALRGSITARKDLAPSAAASARELADGRIAVDYRVADDYRLGSARMIFRAGGRTMAFAVPDVSGRSESQGAVLVPREVLSAAGSKGFNYRLVASDTRRPKPNRGASDELEYRPPQKLAFAGPMLEKQPRPQSSPPTRTGSKGDAPVAGKTTRPLESLYKPDLGEKQPPQPPDPSKPAGKTNEFIAPQGEEAPSKPPEPKGPKGENPADPGRENPDKQGEGRSGDAPDESQGGGQGEGVSPGGEPATTPGNSPSSRPGRQPGGEGGNDSGGEKPPKGNETGSKTPPPERVIPGQVNMKLKPGERLDPRRSRLTGLHTGWGEIRRGETGSSLAPGEVRAPGGEVRTQVPGGRSGGPVGPTIGGRVGVAPQYRRYVNEYLRALSAGE